MQKFNIYFEKWVYDILILFYVSLWYFKNIFEKITEDNNLPEDPSYQAEKLRFIPSNLTLRTCALNSYTCASEKISPSCFF